MGCGITLWREQRGGGVAQERQRRAQEQAQQRTQVVGIEANHGCTCKVAFLNSPLVNPIAKSDSTRNLQPPAFAQADTVSFSHIVWVFFSFRQATPLFAGGSNLVTTAVLQRHALVFVGWPVQTTCDICATSNCCTARAQAFCAVSVLEKKIQRGA